MTVGEMFIRATVAFIVLYFLCRLLNKKLISQMTFFDFVAGITIGSVAASSMLTKDVPIYIGMLGLFIFCLYTLSTNIIAIKSLRGRKILEDEPTYLVKNGKILEEGLKKSRMTMDSLIANLRKKSVFYLDQVDTALLETDGSVSVLKKTPYIDLMKKDIATVEPSRGIPQAFIIDGKILKKSLKVLRKDMKWVDEILTLHNVKHLEDVFVAQIDMLGNVYIDIRDDNENVSAE
ncbi:DUF421 domain-containing protein [Halalkalibacter urbisdiaboli]|uniref:DUF421 domain-containing protein n=1 Tax=Halalkalibacter urbisdiaboli TaxID=1960589 RepID=UPI000B454A3D|nr:DUF421 domain-containing protein [Halalkalibacter urbisdiaboli]